MMRTLMVTAENIEVLRRMFPDEPQGKGGMRPGWEIHVPDRITERWLVDTAIHHATELFHGKLSEPTT